MAVTPGAGRSCRSHEHDSDIPAEQEALDQAEEEAGPGEKREARQEDRQKFMLDRQARHQQIAEDADDVRHREKAAQGETKGDDRDRPHVRFAVALRGGKSGQAGFTHRCSSVRWQMRLHHPRCTGPDKYRERAAFDH
jgi:hypothetical protein